MFVLVGVLVDTGVVGTGVTPPVDPTKDTTLSAGSVYVKLPLLTATDACCTRLLPESVTQG